MARKDKTKNGKNYILLLPYELKKAHFERLNSSPEYIRKKLKEIYDNLDSMHSTFASSAEKALSNIVFREIGRGINSKSIMKMLKPDLGRYVFEVPNLINLGDKLDSSQKQVLRAYNLAEDIAEQKGGYPKDYYPEARNLLNTLR